MHMASDVTELWYSRVYVPMASWPARLECTTIDTPEQLCSTIVTALLSFSSLEPEILPLFTFNSAIALDLPREHANMTSLGML